MLPRNQFAMNNHASCIQSPGSTLLKQIELQLDPASKLAFVKCGRAIAYVLRARTEELAYALRLARAFLNMKGQGFRTWLNLEHPEVWVLSLQPFSIYCRTGMHTMFIWACRKPL